MGLTTYQRLVLRGLLLIIAILGGHSTNCVNYKNDVDEFINNSTISYEKG